MKILVVSQNFYPDVFAVNDVVRILVDRGHEVTVLTGLPDYTTSEIPEEYRHGKNRRQKLFGAKIYRVPTIPRRHGPFWRSLNYLSFALTGSIAANRVKWREFDIIYVWQVSPVTMAIPAIILKKRYKKPLFLYCMDIWPECVKAMGLRERTLPYCIITGISKWIYQRCDRIAVSSIPFFDYLEQIDGVSRKKMSYLPQFASSTLLENDYEKKPDGHFDFLYIGNIGKAQNMPCLIRAIARLQDREDVTFHIIGGGSEFEATKLMAHNLGADKITIFYGPLPFERAAEYYRVADVCILSLDGSNHIGDTLPGKLQTYMAAGKPIIGAMNGAGNKVIKESESGICVDAGDYEALAKSFLIYIEQPERFITYGRNARKYFTYYFTESKHFNTLEMMLQKMVD